MYSDAGQRIDASHNYRPRNPAAALPEDLARFPEVSTFTIDELFGGWAKAQADHFSDGGIFDRLYGL